MALGGSYASKQNIVIGAVLFMFIWYLSFNSQATPSTSVVSQMSRMSAVLDLALTRHPSHAKPVRLTIDIPRARRTHYRSIHHSLMAPSTSMHPALRETQSSPSRPRQSSPSTPT